MDKQSNSTTAPAVSIGEAAATVVETLAMKRQREEAKALADLRNLEESICDLANMAQIMDGLLDSFKNIKSHDGIIRMEVSQKENNLLWFAWNDVTRRAVSLKADFDAAYSGRAAE